MAPQMVRGDKTKMSYGQRGDNRPDDGEGGGNGLLTIILIVVAVFGLLAMAGGGAALSGGGHQIQRMTTGDGGYSYSPAGGGQMRTGLDGSVRYSNQNDPGNFTFTQPQPGVYIHPNAHPAEWYNDRSNFQGQPDRRYNRAWGNP